MTDIPEGREIRTPHEESAITRDIFLYGDAYIHGTIPEWWRTLGRHVFEHLNCTISDEDRRILTGEQ